MKSHQVAAHDLVELVFHHAGEALVDPLDAAVGRTDEHGVVGLGGDEGEFAGLGLAGAQGLLGFAAGVMSCIVPMIRLGRPSAPARRIWRAWQPSASLRKRAHAVFGFDEDGDAPRAALRSGGR
jgi:hypothetical protein